VPGTFRHEWLPPREAAARVASQRTPAMSARHAMSVCCSEASAYGVHHASHVGGAGEGESTIMRIDQQARAVSAPPAVPK